MRDRGLNIAVPIPSPFASHSETNVPGANAFALRFISTSFEKTHGWPSLTRLCRLGLSLIVGYFPEFSAAKQRPRAMFWSARSVCFRVLLLQVLFGLADSAVISCDKYCQGAETGPDIDYFAE